MTTTKFRAVRRTVRTAPRGFKLAEITHAAGAERNAGVQYKIHVVFSADGKVPAQREGFSCHVLATPEVTKTYYGLPGRQLFADSPFWQKGRAIDQVHAYSLTNPDRPGRRELRCRILSTRIVCLYHDDGSAAVIFVGLHAPSLEAIASGARCGTLLRRALSVGT